MKKQLQTLFLLLMGFGVAAQQYYQLPAINAGVNPKGLNTDIEEPSGALTPLGWTVILASTATDAWSPDQTIPFSFDFNGTPETAYKVSNTGVLTFDVGATTVPANPNGGIPNSVIPNKSVLVWGLNISGANDAILSKTFGTAPNRQHWVIFASASATSIGTGFTYWSIVLEEGSNSIYIVDQRTASNPAGGNVSLTAGIQIDGATAIAVSGTPSLVSQTTGASDASDNTFYEFIYGTQPDYDLSLESYDIDNGYGLNQLISGDLTVQNRGTMAVSSFDINYSINGGATVTSTVNRSVSTGDFNTASESTYTPTAAGNYNMKIWVSNINGNPDEVSSNDTLDLTFFAAATVARNVLAEEFSSSTCPPCKTWNDNVYNAALANYNQMGNELVIKYQVPIPTPGDPSRNADSDDRRSYYGVNAAPTMLVNGIEPNYDGIATWTDAANAYAAAEAAGLAKAAFVDITTTAELNGQGPVSTVTINATITPNIDMSGGDYRAQVVVLQKAYTFNGATNGDFNYKHVMRKMLPDADGTTLTVAAGASQSITESFTFDVGNVAMGNFNLWNNDIEVIVFVENTNTQTISNAKQASVTTIGLNESEVLTGVKVFPNPASGVVHVSIENEDVQKMDVSIVNAIGQQVFSGSYTEGQRLISIPTDKYDAGVYIINLKGGNKVATQRLVITD